MRSSCSRRRAGQAVDAREEVQVLADAQVAVERKLLGHVTHASAGGARGLVKVEAGHAGTAGGRPQQAAHHLERGRLAGAVGAREAEDLAATDAEGDLVGGREIPEPLGQPLRLHDRDSVVAWLAGRAGEGRSSLAAAAQQVDEGILEARRRRLDLGTGAPRSLADGGRAPSLVTSRTLLPWITPSMISGRCQRRPEAAARPGPPPPPENCGPRRAPSAPWAVPRRGPFPRGAETPGAQRSASSR